MRHFVLALIVDIVDVDPSEHVIIVDKEGQIESEIDQGPEHLNQCFNSIKVKISKIVQRAALTGSPARRRKFQTSYVMLFVSSRREEIRQHLFNSRDSSLKLRRKPEMM